MHLFLRSLQKRPLKVRRSFIFILGCIFYQEIHIKSSVWATSDLLFITSRQSFVEPYLKGGPSERGLWLMHVRLLPPCHHMINGIFYLIYILILDLGVFRQPEQLFEFSKASTFDGSYIIHETSTISHVKGLPALNMKPMNRYRTTANIYSQY